VFAAAIVAITGIPSMGSLLLIRLKHGIDLVDGDITFESLCDPGAMLELASLRPPYPVVDVLGVFL
jgi:hypothetical protein